MDEKGRSVSPDTHLSLQNENSERSLDIERKRLKPENVSRQKSFKRIDSRRNEYKDKDGTHLADKKRRYSESSKYANRNKGDGPSDEKYKDKDIDDRRRHNSNEKYKSSRRNKGHFNERNRNEKHSKSSNHDNMSWGKTSKDAEDSQELIPDKQKPNFGLSGKLTEETNTYRGVVIKYSEPPEARKPKRRWRLYPFKGEKSLQTLFIHRESAYLIGRERKIVDIPVDHPSCSKQHAALQYRLVTFSRDDGSTGKRVRPYLIDLNSANGTFINNKKIESSKYIELLEKDVIKFGFSSREYVMLHENSKDEIEDDDVKLEEIKVEQ